MSSDLLRRSKTLFHADLDHICLENIQICILIANIHAAESFSSEALYFGKPNIAHPCLGSARFVPEHWLTDAGIALQMLHILTRTPEGMMDDPLEREVMNRVYWTLFMADRWYSFGLGLTRQMVDFKSPFNLPINEYSFYSTSEGETCALSQSPGLWSHMVTLVNIFGPIQDLNQKLVQELMSDQDADVRVKSLQIQLQDWEEALPDDTKFNQENLFTFQHQELGGAFIALHLGYHHYATLLCFRYLDKSHLNSSQGKAYAAQCKRHAIPYSALLKTSREVDKCEAVYPTVGYMALVSSAVLLHVLLFGNEGEAAEARGSLTANFAALLGLKMYWPRIVTLMVDRLYTFQHKCMESPETSSYKLNEWMLRFLFEHHLPLKDSMLEQVTTPATAIDLVGTFAEARRLYSS